MAHPDDQIVGGHLDEGTVHAWLDGQLPAEEAARVESHVAGCAACQTQVAEARGFIAASSRILTALDSVPARVVPMRRRGVQLWHVRAAAAVLIVALGTATVLHEVRVPEFSPSRELTLSDSQRPSAVTAANEAEKPIAPSAAKAAPPARARDESRGSGVRGRGSEADGAPSVRRRAENKEQISVSGVPGASPPLPSAAPAGVAGGAAVQGVVPPAPAITGGIASSAPEAQTVQPRRLDAGASARNSAMASDSVAASSLSRTMVMAAPRAAERDITGRVVAADRKTPVSSAIVTVLGSPNHVLTDSSGSFQLRASVKKVTLFVRRVGYLPTAVDVAANQQETTIAMATNGDRLDLVQTEEEPNAAKRALGQSRLAGPSASACVGLTVTVPSGVTSSDGQVVMATVQLEAAPSTDAHYPGFGLGTMVDSGAPAGAWTPLGPDSAILTLPVEGPGVLSQARNGNADSVAPDALRDHQVVRRRVRCAPR